MCGNGSWHTYGMRSVLPPGTGCDTNQDTLKGFLRRAQNEFGLRIKKIRSDNGMEFKNSQIEGFLEDEGIKHEFSSPYTPQQNGVVERKNRTLLDMARTMLDEYKQGRANKIGGPV
jgi:transposase InsO family protein